MNSIFRRRSIRKYEEKEITDQEIELLLRSGMAAPSAHNKQPWEFIVTKKRNILNKVANIHPYAKMLNKAPLGIVVCANSEKQNVEGFFVQDCAAAIQNILVQGQDMGLGSVWIGIYPYKELMDMIKEIFLIPDNIVPIAMISIGYPAEEKHEITRYKKELVHVDKY